MEFKDIIKEEDVVEFSKKVYKKSIESIVEEIENNFSSEMEAFILKKYDGLIKKSEDDLIRKIVGNFITDDQNFKYNTLRTKLFQENEDFLKESLSEDIILKNLEKTLFDHSIGSYYFKWQWEDAIADFIIKNESKFVDSERINNKFLRVISSLQEKIKHLESIQPSDEDILNSYQ